MRFIDGTVFPRAESRGITMADQPITLLRRHELRETAGQKTDGLQHKVDSEIPGPSEVTARDSIITSKVNAGTCHTELY